MAYYTSPVVVEACEIPVLEMVVSKYNRDIMQVVGHGCDSYGRALVSCRRLDGTTARFYPSDLESVHAA